jgi:sodium/proline symporter
MFGTGLGALGQPQLLNRIMAVKSAKDRRMGAAITIGWGVLIYLGLIILALSARVTQLETGDESVFFAAAQAYLPAVLAGIAIATVLSAVMSTVDSLLLAAASAVSHDMGFSYRSDKVALMAGRLAIVGVALLAILVTLFAPQEIFKRVLFAWVALGAAFGPTILLRALGMKFHDKAILLAVIVGFTTAVVAYSFPGGVAEIFEKWVSWSLGLIILLIGRKSEGAAKT